MIKSLLMVDTALWWAVIAGLTAWVVRLKRVIKSSKDPWFALPRRERRRLAREELAQRKEDRDIEQLAATTRALNEGKTHL